MWNLLVVPVTSIIALSYLNSLVNAFISSHRLPYRGVSDSRKQGLARPTALGKIFAANEGDDLEEDVSDMEIISKIANLHVIDRVYNPITMTNFQDYKAEHQESITNPKGYWASKAQRMLDWYVEPTTISNGGFAKGDITWFEGGKMNVCYNALDRYVRKTPKNIAIRFEGDEPGDVQSFTFEETLSKVCQIANALKSKGVRKGDVVTIYMPMIPELPMTMLACARIGAVHSVVFAGFSSEALASRIEASSSRFLVTADQGVRGGKKINLKDTVNAALKSLPNPDWMQTVFVYERNFDELQSEVTYDSLPKDVRMNVLLKAQRPYCPCEVMDAEDDLFILYTSGSTGKPKGLVHTTAGYALYAMLTSSIVFDLRPETNFACVADCGWITGHTYITYGKIKIDSCRRRIIIHYFFSKIILLRVHWHASFSLHRSFIKWLFYICI